MAISSVGTKNFLKSKKNVLSKKGRKKEVREEDHKMEKRGRKKEREGKERANQGEEKEGEEKEIEGRVQLDTFSSLSRQRDFKYREQEKKQVVVLEKLK